jgi:hypothetical protein
MQNFLDGIGHFPNISLSTGSALAGLNGLRQSQSAGRNGAAGPTVALLPCREPDRGGDLAVGGGDPDRGFIARQRAAFAEAMAQ